MHDTRDSTSAEQRQASRLAGSRDHTAPHSWKPYSGHDRRGIEGKSGFLEFALGQSWSQSCAIIPCSMLNVTDVPFSLSIGVMWVFPHLGTAEAANLASPHWLSQQTSQQQQLQEAALFCCLPPLRHLDCKPQEGKLSVLSVILAPCIVPGMRKALGK